MNMLAGKVAIVSGASSGIGRAAALLFARAGAKLVVTARRTAELQALEGEIAAAGGTATAIAGDVRDDGHARALVAAAQDLYGGLDIALNNAGTTGVMAPVAALSPADWRDSLDSNLTASFLAARHQAPALQARGGGSLIFTGSFVGHTAGMPGMAAYAAAKAGLVGLVQCLAVELGARRDPGQCAAARRHRYGDERGPCTRRRAGGAGLRAEPACPEAACRPRGDRPGRPVPRVGRRQLRHRQRPAGRWRRVDQPDLIPSTCRQPGLRLPA